MWEIASTSVLGESHRKSGIVCQDAHSHSVVCAEWLVAVIADGAGSYKHSDLGAKFVVENVCSLVKSKLERIISDNNQKGFVARWGSLAHSIFYKVSVDLKQYAESLKLPYKEFGCTVILSIVTPECLFTAHIGDGRAAYHSPEKGWQSCITPYKGAEANSTIFITLPIWENVDEYIETRVISEPVDAVILMTDGCESASYKTRTLNYEFIHKLLNLSEGLFLDESRLIRQALNADQIDIIVLGKIVTELSYKMGKRANEIIPGMKMMYDANLPNSEYLDYLCNIVFSSNKIQPNLALRQELCKGDAFVDEDDDKTMILCRWQKNKSCK